MAVASAQAAELRAANVVRRAIQKLRLATPENVDALETEVFDAMQQQLEAMGSQHEKVQLEFEKAVEQGRKHAAAIQAKRDKEAEMAKRPKELIEEIKALMEPLQAKLANLKGAACLEDKTVELQPEDAPTVSKLAEEFSAEIKDFSQQCVTRAAEIKEATLPLQMKTDWAKLAHEIADIKRSAELTVTQAKHATVKATEAIRKKKLEQKKAALKEKIAEATAVGTDAEQFVISAESLVEPFTKGAPKKEAEMLELAKKVDEAVEVARSNVDAAAKDMKAPISPDGEEEEEDELLKKEIAAFVAAEAKRPTIRLGQFRNRIKRCATIVGRYRKELRDVHNRSIFDGLKAELLEKVKGEEWGKEAFANVEPLIKAAETGVEPFPKHAKLTSSEMQGMAAEVSKKVEAAKAALEALSEEVCPIDPSLDEDVKKKLKLVAQPHIKQLGQMESRLTRITNLLTTFRADAEKKRASEKQNVRSVAVRVLRKHMATAGQEADALFAQGAGGADNLDKDAFVALFSEMDKSVPMVGSEGEEQVELSADDLEALFASCVKNGATALSKDAFQQLVVPRMKVVKAATLTSALSIAEGKTLRPLSVGETLEALEGPVKEEKTGVMRVRAKAVKDGKEGWATLAGNAGTIFLRESDLQ